MDRRHQVMQFLGEVHSVTPWGSPVSWRVFRTGDDGWFLFDVIDGDGCSVGMQYPVRKADLRRDVRVGLQKGGTLVTAARQAYDRGVWRRPVRRRCLSDSSRRD